MKADPSCLVDKILEISVQPRASRNEILGFQNQLLRIRVTAPPSDGQANLLLRRFLAEELGVPPSRVEILRGDKGRRKRIRVTGVRLENLERLEPVKREKPSPGGSAPGVPGKGFPGANPGRKRPANP